MSVFPLVAALSVVLWKSDTTPPQLVDPVISSRDTVSGAKVTTATFSPRIGPEGGVKYTHTFTLKNNSDMDLVINDITKSCGCLSATPDTTVMPPGKEAQLSVAVRADNTFFKQVCATVSLSSGKTESYCVQTTTYPQVMLDDGGKAGVSAGVMEPASNRTVLRQLYVHSYTSDGLPPELDIESGQASSGLACSLMPREVAELNDRSILRRVYDVQITITAPPEAGMVNRSIQFVTTGGKGAGERFTLPVSWRTLEGVVVSPSRWLVRPADLSSGEPLTKSFELSHRLKKIIHIRSLKPLDECLNAKCDGQRVDVILDPSKLPASRPFLGRIQLELECGESTDSQRIDQTLYTIVGQ